jgi:hypothetical protein
MRTLIALSLLALLPLAAAAQTATDPVVAPAPIVDPAVLNPELRVYNSASQLNTWCRDEAEAQAVGRGHTTYQWTSSHSERGNTLKVDGKLHVEGGDFTVSCRIARGARQEFASIEMELVPR